MFFLLHFYFLLYILTYTNVWDNILTYTNVWDNSHTQMYGIGRGEKEEKDNRKYEKES